LPDLPAELEDADDWWERTDSISCGQTVNDLVGEASIGQPRRVDRHHRKIVLIPVPGDLTGVLEDVAGHSAGWPADTTSWIGTKEPPIRAQTRQTCCVQPPGVAVGVAVGEGVTSVTGYSGSKSESETVPTSVA
jgi:hypothetical protein